MSDIVELRQYTLHPRRRDELIELFDHEFLDTQRDVGIRVLGQFRDLDNPDRFVWLRGFESMAARHDALVAFYGGTAWATHRDAANATMIDSDDVLLLRPARGHLMATDRHLHSRVDVTSHFVIAIASFDSAADADEGSGVLAAALVEQARTGGIATVGLYETEPAENTYLALPLRTGEHVVVWITRFDTSDDAATAEPILSGLLESSRPRSIAWRRLQPTSRSSLR